MASVFLVGMATLDVIMSTDKIPAAAEKYVAYDAQIVGGGCAANAAVAVSRLGGDATLATRLGSDAFADVIASDLIAEGVCADYIHKSTNGRSSFSSVSIDAVGERQIVNFRGTGLSEITEWMEPIPVVNAILVDTRWPDGALTALAAARLQKIPGIVDAEAPIDPRLLSQASHVAFSRTGLAALSDEPDPGVALAQIRHQINAWACVTDGENGVYFTQGNSIEHVPAFVVETRDTLGAGDVWHAGFALRLAEGADEQTAIVFANAVAALKCTKIGGRTGCPDRLTTKNFLKQRLS